jgi:tetratricopeptide (TPR) repeat protein
MRQAERQLGEGLYEKAVASLERAIAANGDGYTCTLRIADIYRKREKWSAAYDAVEKATALSPTRLPAYEMALTIALEAGDRARVLRASQALIKLEPRHLYAHNALGAIYIQLGDVDAAMRAANTLIRIDPHNAAHRFKKALLCQHKGEIALAVHEFSLAISLEPEGPHSEAARESLEVLDSFQLNQIATLAMEDQVFRAKLSRDPVGAVSERGFTLSDLGNHVLLELSAESLADLPEPTRPTLYN